MKIGINIKTIFENIDKPIKEEQKQIIKKLQEKGHTIAIVVTTEETEVLQEQIQRKYQAIMEEWLKANEISYDNLVITSEADRDICVNNGINYMVKDVLNEDTFESISKLTGYASIDKPWLKYYRPYAYELSNNIPAGKSVWDIIEEKILDYDSIPVIAYYGRKILKDEFIDMVNKWAKTFKILGVKEQDVVPIYGLLTPSIAAMMFALNSIGACSSFVKLTIDETNLEEETKNSTIAIVLKEAANEKIINFFNNKRFSTTIITSATDDMPYLKGKIASAFLSLKTKNIKKGHNNVSLNEALKMGEEYLGKTKCEFEKDRNFVITYSSGTTGGVKGTVATNESAISQLLQGHYSDIPYDRGDTILASLPPAASTSLNCLFLYGLYHGLTIDINPALLGKDFYKYIVKTKPQVVLTTGGVWLDFFKEYKRHSDGKPIDYFDSPIMGGEGVVPCELDEMNEYLLKNGSKTKIASGFGLSELFSVITFQNPRIEVIDNELHSVVNVGIPFCGMDIGIYDLNGCELKYNEIGELWVKSKSAMKEYYNKKELTEATFTSDGWVKTGDLCSLTSEGLLFLYGRKEDSFSSENGNVIYFFNIESDIINFSNHRIKKCLLTTSISKTTKKLVVHVVFKDKDDDIKSILKEVYNQMIDRYDSLFSQIEFSVYEEFELSPTTLKIDRNILKRNNNGTKYLFGQDNVINCQNEKHTLSLLKK